ncbi:MAG: hypothetical protein JJ959_06855 [Nisaea sp.]|uniref:hypothetical protein n=1 Tax=Nisaea sp. TaxID=2024842 RepID=UPI001B1FCE00|nr:hypothetical protein [Nisaea sp.]MBO6560238.1 hypothetical protein [Nisaea sp.]
MSIGNAVNFETGFSIMNQSTSALVPHCRRVFSRYLENFGYTVESGTDMNAWCEVIRRQSNLVNPQFEPENLDQSNSRYVHIRNEAGDLACTIAFRFFDTDDFLDHFEAGRLFYDYPEAHGWVRHHSGLRDKVHLDGKICSRGGLHSYDRGNSISWYITTLAYTYAIEAGANATVGNTFPKITAAQLAPRLYGYRHSQMMHPHSFPFTSGEVSLALVWITDEEMREEVRMRTQFLETSPAMDMRSTVDSFNGALMAAE